MGLFTIGVIAAAKLAGIAAGSYVSWTAFRSNPEAKIRRRMTGLFRDGDLCLKLRRKRGKESFEVKRYPSILKIMAAPDRNRVTFQIPDGLDPAEVWKREYLFRQGFGEYVELLEERSKVFVMCAYSEDMKKYNYSLEAAQDACKGLALPIYVGSDRSGVVAYDMIEHPHLLIAGETGSGKSVALRSVLSTLVLLAGDRIELYCADLKRSEFHLFRGIAKRVDVESTALLQTLHKLKREIRRRGDILDRAEVPHIDELPKAERLPYIVLAVDEVAMLQKEKEINAALEEISAIGRALGVFLILATQRPDSDVLDGKLKLNMTVRMAGRMNNVMNSNIVLGSGEAATIRADQKGRMAFSLQGVKYVQVPLLDTAAAKKLLSPHKSVTDGSGSKRAAEPQAAVVDVEEVEADVWGVIDDVGP